MLVEAGNVDAGDLGNFQQELVLGPVLGLGLVIEGNDLHGTLLALAQGEEIEEIRQGLGVEGADTAGEDDILQALPVLGMEGNARQTQHVQHIGVGHLIADGEGHQIEVLHGVLAFQRPQGEAVLFHSLLHVAQGGEDTLAPDAVHFVHDAVENAHAQVGHADLIGIRETEGDPDADVIQVFFYFIEFSAGVSGRFLHRGEDSLDQIGHNVIPLLFCLIACSIVLFFPMVCKEIF